MQVVAQCALQGITVLLAALAKHSENAATLRCIALQHPTGQYSLMMAITRYTAAWTISCESLQIL